MLILSSSCSSYHIPFTHAHFSRSPLLSPPSFFIILLSIEQARDLDRLVCLVLQTLSSDLYAQTCADILTSSPDFRDHPSLCQAEQIASWALALCASCHQSQSLRLVIPNSINSFWHATLCRHLCTVPQQKVDACVWQIVEVTAQHCLADNPAMLDCASHPPIQTQVPKVFAIPRKVAWQSTLLLCAVQKQTLMMLIREMMV